jgi:hypothetical protein
VPKNLASNRTALPWAVGEEGKRKKKKGRREKLEDKERREKLC